MAEAAVAQLATFRPLRGVVAAPAPHTPDKSTHHEEDQLIGGCVRVIAAGHPIPTEGSERAASALIDAITHASPRTLVLALISGGASALLAAPAHGISLADKQLTTALCLRSGAPITDLNTLRKHMSRLKGGQLARCAAPRPVISLILSDVIGDPLEVKRTIA